MPYPSRLVFQLIALGLMLALGGPFCMAQSDSTDSFEGIASRIFLPSLDLGFQFPNASVLGPGFVTRTSLEYRAKNNNDFFIRLTYDTYGSRYVLPTNNTTTNSISGTVQFSDIMLAPGYRFGDAKYRLLVAVMGGIKLYEFPTATIENQQVTVGQDGKSIFTSGAMASAEYYFDEKSALTFSLYHNQVWKDIDFWTDGRIAWGLSIGFITALI